MELLAGAMRVIQGNDFVCTACQVRPVGVDFDIGHEQAVVIVVVETFNHLECHGHRSTGGLRTAGAQVIDSRCRRFCPHVCAACAGQRAGL